eukprot:1000675-Heterocapsa_arctica.AAC.1
MTAFKGQDNKHGNKVRGTDQLTKELKKGWMKPQPEHYTTTMVQTYPMKAGALHTIFADGVWTPRRAHKRANNSNGDCLLCGEKNAG